MYHILLSKILWGRPISIWKITLRQWDVTCWAKIRRWVSLFLLIVKAVFWMINTWSFLRTSSWAVSRSDAETSESPMRVMSGLISSTCSSTHSLLCAINKKDTNVSPSVKFLSTMADWILPRFQLDSWSLPITFGLRPTLNAPLLT